MASRFPGLKANMGDMEYCLVTMTLGELTKNVQYVEQVQNWKDGISEELKMQRKLNIQRVKKEMVPYLVDVDDHFFSALTVEHMRDGEIDHSIKFETLKDNLGEVVLDGTETLFALDGQHRLKAIELALQEEPKLAREKIAVILVPYKNVRRSQQLFSDLNRYVKATSKTLNILFDSRDFMAAVAKAVIEKSRYLYERVNMETNSLSKNSKDIITLGVLYECVKAILGKSFDTDDTDGAVDLIHHAYDDVIFPALPGINDVIKGKLHPSEIRTKYVYCHSIGQQAIAHVVKSAIEFYGDDWEKKISEGFSKIDWRIKNRDWEGCAVQGGRIVNRSQPLTRTAALIKIWLGIEVSENELDDLEKAMVAVEPRWKVPNPII